MFNLVEIARKDMCKLMKISFKRKVKLIILAIIIFTAGGFFIAYRIYHPAKQSSSQWIVPNINNPSNKYITKDALVKEIQQKNELISMETELSEEVTIDDSWGTLPIFKKIQNVQFTGEGIYTIDLSKLASDNLSLDNKNKSITITSPAPTVKSITIDEQKTIYETPEHGFLRFGEIKLTTAELQSIQSSAKSKMNEKMLSPELYTQAQNNTKTALSDFVKSLLGKEASSYTIDVQFKK